MSCSRRESCLGSPLRVPVNLGFAPRQSHLLKLAPRGLRKMRHAYLTPVARGVEGGSQSYVLDAASGQPYLARQPREINVAGKRGFAWKSHLPDALSIFFIREGELNDEPQSPHERIVHVPAQVRRQDSDAIVLFHLLQQV